MCVRVRVRVRCGVPRAFVIVGLICARATVDFLRDSIFTPCFVPFGSKNETLHMNARRVGSACCIELKPSAYELHDVTHHLTMFRINLCTDDDGTVVFCSASK